MKYWKQVRDAYQTYCPRCPLSLLCLTGRQIRDLKVCVSCASLFSAYANLVVRCDGFLEKLGGAAPWGSGMCPVCYHYSSWDNFQVVEGFTFDTPDIEAIKDALQRQLQMEETSARR